MKKENWIWMGHLGHFCMAFECRFRLNTYVGGFIVSTVGELMRDGKIDKLGLNANKDIYETMVFRAGKSRNVECCPYGATGEEVDYEGYKTSGEAAKGHMAMCEKWSKKR